MSVVQTVWVFSKMLQLSPSKRSLLAVSESAMGCLINLWCAGSRVRWEGSIHATQASWDEAWTFVQVFSTAQVTLLSLRQLSFLRQQGVLTNRMGISAGFYAVSCFLEGSWVYTGCPLSAELRCKMLGNSSSLDMLILKPGKRNTFLSDQKLYRQS